MAITIREAVIEDAAAIAEVHVASWRWAYGELLPAETLDGLDIAEREAGWFDVLASEDPRDRIMVAEGRNGLVGFAHIGATRDDDAPAGTGELFAIYLAEHEAGSGLGTNLLARSTEALREEGFGRATLWVLKTNERARRFYGREGWAWDGTTSTHQVQCANLPIVRYEREL